MVSSAASHHTLPTTAPSEFSLDDPSDMMKKMKKAAAASKRASDDSTLRLTASTNNLSLGNQTESFGGGVSRNGNNNNHNHDSVDLKRVWHTMLKECHRADPERTGHVSRNAFITALERGNTNSVSVLF